VITDGEQRKYHNVWTYSVHALPITPSDGFKILFAAGHVRPIAAEGMAADALGAR
jgi:5-methyltetrahydropteroyltriglutamate--homocysteine methyltransferase